MALPVIFANLPTGNTAASTLDQNFAALGAISTIPCVAAGTSAYTLTPAANSPTITAYNQLQAFRAVIPNTSTGTVTAGLASPGLLACYTDGAAGPVAAGSGDLVASNSYDFVYDVALNSGAGGFHVYNVVVGSAANITFSANKNNVDQTGIISATLTKITFTNEEWDTGGYYDAPNSKFLPLVPGKYLITAGVYVTAGVVDLNQYQVAIFLNGSVYRYGNTVNASGTLSMGPQAASIVAMNGTTDFVEIYFFGGGGGNKTIGGQDNLTFFQGVKIA